MEDRKKCKHGTRPQISGKELRSESVLWMTSVNLPMNNKKKCMKTKTSQPLLTSNSGMKETSRDKSHTKKEHGMEHHKFFHREEVASLTCSLIQ